MHSQRARAFLQESRVMHRARKGSLMTTRRRAGFVRVGFLPALAFASSHASLRGDTKEALGQAGNSAPRFFHGPGQETFDLGLEKNTIIRESLSLLIRAEFFNAFNDAQFNNP